MYLLTSQAWRSSASSLPLGPSRTFPPSQPVPPGLLRRLPPVAAVLCLLRPLRRWLSVFTPAERRGEPHSCGGKAARPGRAGSRSLGQNSPGRSGEMHGQRFPASQTRSFPRSEKQVSSAWHSRLGLVFFFPQAEETPISPGAEANSSESPLQRQKRKG